MGKHNPTMPVHSSEILKGIKLTGRRGSPTYPFDDMVVDDAFFTTCKGVSGSASAYGKKNGMKFTTRAYTHEGKKGYMCWRIA